MKGCNKFGFPDGIWSAAKEEARAAMRAVARDASTISYSALAARVLSISFKPRSPDFHQLLGEISTEEDAEQRGMLSVLVVRKDGDRRPGRGFFRLAGELGRDASDKEAFWVEELTAVYSIWS